MAANTAKRQKFTEKANRAFAGVTEPEVREASYSIDLTRALNYYNLHETPKVIAKWITGHFNKTDKNIGKLLEQASENELYYVGIIYRLGFRKQFVAQKELDYFNTKIQELVAKYSAVAPVVVSTKTKAPVISIQDRISELANKYGAEIDYEIDQFIQTGSSDFTAKSYFLQESISGVVCKRIAEFYKPTQRELADALEGTDELLSEGYSNLSKQQLKKLSQFVDSIVLDCQQQVVTSKVAKPRKFKQKPAGVLVARMKYKLTDPDSGIKSCDPADIIGASEVWVFNSKTRQLAVYRAASTDVLSVKGTTIQNYDVGLSELKQLRKPKEFFTAAGMTKRPLTAAFKAIKGVTKCPNGRVNSDIIIYKAF